DGRSSRTHHENSRTRPRVDLTEGALFARDRGSGAASGPRASGTLRTDLIQMRIVTPRLGIPGRLMHPRRAAHLRRPKVRHRLACGGMAALAVLALTACGFSSDDSDLTLRTRRAHAQEPAPTPDRSPDVPLADQRPPYTVSPRGGLPASGPGARYNHCERIW